MTPWLRTAGLLLVLGTGSVVNPCGGVPAYGVGAGSTGGAGGGPAAVTAPASASPSATALKPASGPDHHDQAPARPEPSRAGSQAGEGRERPGRTARPSAEEDENGGADEDTAEPTADEDGASAVPTAADSASPSEEAAAVPSSPPLRPVHQTVTHAEDDPTEPVLRILPLGSGLILIGLGLGLAFIGLRVRRG
ncbi:hypothetical protein [Streptomyces hokutonensis]|uniref:hypothetical protein n=1 Tax=Streptomyces hokutonensis TaxID=1306990 RepID=UPI00037FAC2F|nr:hypothetical protein [Streptomyces hokutonensis]